VDQHHPGSPGPLSCTLVQVPPARIHRPVIGSWLGLVIQGVLSQWPPHSFMQSFLSFGVQTPASANPFKRPMPDCLLTPKEGADHAGNQLLTQTNCCFDLAPATRCSAGDVLGSRFAKPGRRQMLASWTVRPRLSNGRIIGSRGPKDLFSHHRRTSFSPGRMVGLYQAPCGSFGRHVRETPHR